jgi:photosystem II stability/assembly factor-like uncharacterized protein
MSGFDFESLRDPNAPQPGPHQREGVEMRAQELVTRARRRSTLLSALAVLVVVGVVAGIVATRPDNDHVIVESPSSTTTAAPPTHRSIDGRFIPPTTIDNGTVTLPVTFPDGERVTLGYPEAMQVAQLGFAGSTGVNWPVESGNLQCCSKPASITYQTVADVYGDATPVHVYRGPNGEPVPYFHASQARKPVGPKFDFLAFQFGPWLVQVYDVTDSQTAGSTEARMTDAQRETWARSLTGTVDAHGYLLLHAAAPLSLSNGFEGGFGASPGNAVELAANTVCGQPESDTNVRRHFTNGGGSGVAWCAGDLHVAVTGTTSFVDLAAKLFVYTSSSRPLTSSTSSTTTTTTAPPAVSPTNAASASFVSPEHGWILEHDGTVTETTDGGHTWRPVGSLGLAVATVKLRFADANRGFAIPTDNVDSTALTTDDGGATWTTLDLPFPGRIYDLAISRGIVYVAAFDQSNAKFRIWTSPADNLSWTEDPIEIPVGAGPVPTIQLVFSDGAGWLMEVDRTVVAGAQMSTGGTWTKWTPPCATANGPATLAAWSATDLIASCQEGAWGSPPAPGTAVYTSHDDGATFQPQDAPVYGQVAAADPNYAILVTSDTIRRSVDGGRTWTIVESPNSGPLPASDLGFTSNSQGFVIFDNGVMLMTHDAGATWTATTRP